VNEDQLYKEPAMELADQLNCTIEERDDSLYVKDVFTGGGNRKWYDTWRTLMVLDTGKTVDSMVR
jgi:hypothetical protein